MRAWAQGDKAQGFGHKETATKQAPRNWVNIACNCKGFPLHFFLWGGSSVPQGRPSCRWDGMIPKKRHSRDQQKTFSIASIVLCFTTKCCFKPKRGMRIFFFEPCKQGKFKVKTFRECERSQLHGTPSIHIPSGSSCSASVCKMSAPLWRTSMSSVGNESKFLNWEISENWLNWCKISWGKRKGKSFSFSCCSFSDQTGMEAQYRWGHWCSFKSFLVKSRALFIPGWWLPARSPTFEAPASSASANKLWARCPEMSPDKKASDRLARKRFSLETSLGS